MLREEGCMMDFVTIGYLAVALMGLALGEKMGARREQYRARAGVSWRDASKN